MIVLIKLILAHFIGDFLLQPNSWVDEEEIKKATSLKLYIHILIHGFLVFLVLWDFKHWLLALLLMVSHGIVHVIKLYAQKETNKSYWFLMAQGLHIINILVLWMICIKPELNLNTLVENSSIWIYTVALLFISLVSGIVMRELMSSWSKALNDSNEESLNNAGK